MANVSFDAEFMKQWLPSLPISNAKSFQVVRDEQFRPIIFAIGTAGTLSALLPGGTNGQYVRLDLGALFGLNTSDVVSSLFVLQDTALKIYLTFAVNGATSGDPSALYVVHPTMPRDWQAAVIDKKAPALLRDISNEKHRITQLHLGGAADTTTGYPLVVVVYSGPKIDAACLDIDVAGGTWKYADTFELPETPDQLKDICAGAVAPGINGLFYLYDIQHKTRLTFAGFKSGTFHQPYSTSLRPPPGAQCLATFVNKRGLTDLLIGGDAVYHYTANDAAHSDPLNGPDRFVRVTNDSELHLTHLQQISVAQATSLDALCIYGRNGDNTVVYQQCNVSFPTAATATLSLNGPSIPLLTREQGGGSFTVLFDKATGSQKLFISGTDSALTCMELSGGTRLWQRTVMLLPSTEENTEITSYTSHIHVADQDSTPVVDTKFLLCSSSAVDLASNSVPISVTASGVLVSTDESGDITLIQNVTGLSSVVFTLKDDPHATKAVLGKSHILNPAKKVQQILGTIKTPDDARKTRLPNGQALLGSANGSDKDNAANALPLLCQALAKMPEDGSEHPEAVAASEYYNSIGTWLWEGWEYIHKALGKVENFFIDAWHFVVTFAGKAYRFVLKSLSHVLEALHWVLQDVLGIPIDTIVEWLGFLFNWGDILETHDILAAMVNTGIDYAIAKTHDFKDIVDGWFEKADEKLKSFDSISDEIKGHTIGPSPNTIQPPPKDDETSVTKTPGGNWSAYQIKHGGVGNSLRAQESALPSGNSLLKFWEGLEASLGNIRDDVVNAIKGIMGQIHLNKNISIEQLLQHFGIKLLRDLLTLLRKIIDGVIEFIAGFAGEVKTLINKSIDIPLLTALYRSISKHDLTMLDAIALLIAVPTTILCKAVSGKKPGDLPGAKEFLNAYKAPHLRFMSNLSAHGATQSPSSNALLTSTSGELYASDSFDDIVNKFKSIGSLLGTIGAPCGNTIMLLFAPFDWFTSGPGDQGVGNSRWGWKIVGGIFVSACTFPYAEIPGHSDLRLLRELAWGVNALSILATPTGVRIRGIVSLATGSFQCVIEIISIYYAIKTAEDNQYGGNLDSKDVWLDICDRIFAAIGKAAGGVCMVVEEPEPYAPAVALLTGGGAVAFELAKAVKFHWTLDGKAGMPQGSLVGIS